MRDVYIIKCNNVLTIYFLNVSVGYNSRQCLITMIEKWRESVDEGGSFSALLTDLSKVFDCLPHELLIAKLHAYSFDMKSQNLIYDYLSNRRQR